MLGYGRVTVAGNPNNPDGYTNSLELDPFLAADPDTAAQIAAFGLRDGLFRPGKGKLSDFTKDGHGTREDLIRARQLVNAKRLAAEEIADNAIRYWNQIRGNCF